MTAVHNDLTDPFRTFADAIPNYNTSRLGPLYYGLVLALQPRTIIETGVFHGCSTAWLARGAAEVGATLTCVDIDPTLPERLRDIPMPLNGAYWIGDALEYLRANTADLYVIDDCHEYEHVEAELITIFRTCQPRATIIVHDALNADVPDVRLALSAFKPLWLPASCGVAIIQVPEGPRGYAPVPDWTWENDGPLPPFK